MRILFLCVGNMCRSPMAEAIARELGQDRVEALSAGLQPAGAVDANALAALEALGYPSVGLSSKSVAEVPLRDMDVIVSLIGPDGLAILPRNLAARTESWSIRDPLGEEPEAFVAAARAIEQRVRGLLRELLG